MPGKIPVRLSNTTKKVPSRLAKLRLLRSRLDVTHILITDPIDAAYISGFISSNVALLIGPRSDLLFTDFRYHGAASDFCKQHSEWKYQRVEKTMAEAIGPNLTKKSIVGFQSDHCTVDDYKRLKKHTCNVRFIGISKHLQEMLFVKKKEEVAAMERAARIGDKAFAQLMHDIQSGVTERDLVKRLERYCSDFGSEKPSFDTIVLFGKRSALPHGIPGNNRLKKGSFVLIDFGCTVDGFCSDMTRTIVFGTATKKQRRFYTVVKNAQHYARKYARCEMSACAIDALARDAIATEGYGDAFGHALGHGVGRRIHEAPRISAQESLPIPENTVFTIEPGIYFPGFGGIRIEDMVVMGRDGVRLLTHSPRELLEL